MADLKSLRNVLVTAAKAIVVLVVDIALLRWGALAIDAHDDLLLAAGFACSAAALAITVAAGAWIIVGLRRSNTRLKRLP